MNLSARVKFNVILATCVVVGFVMIVIVANTQSRAILVGLLAWLLVCTVALFRVRCQNCGRSVAYQGKVLGLPVYGGIAHKTCRECGFDLTKARGGKG